MNAQASERPSWPLLARQEALAGFDDKPVQHRAGLCWGCCASGPIKKGTKRSLVKNETRDRVNAARLEYTHETELSGTHTTPGRATVKSARSGGRALKQQSVPRLRFSGGWTTRG